MLYLVSNIPAYSIVSFIQVKWQKNFLISHKIPEGAYWAFKNFAVADKRFRNKINPWDILSIVKGVILWGSEVFPEVVTHSRSQLSQWFDTVNKICVAFSNT